MNLCIVQLTCQLPSKKRMLLVCVQQLDLVRLVGFDRRHFLT